MEIDFFFYGLKPVSTNKLYSRNKQGRRFKTSEASKFQALLNLALNPRGAEIFTFETHFSPYEHGLIGGLYIWTPETILFTKKGYISHRSMDCNNHKIITDTIFSRFEKLDDKYLVSETCKKLVSPDNNWHIAYTLERICLDDYREASDKIYKHIKS